MGVRRSRAQREHYITIRNGVIGHVQKPVCSHGSDLPGSEALGEIPAFPPPQLYLCPDCQLFYGEAHAWVMDKQNRHAPHRPRFYFRSRPTLKMINRLTKHLFSEKQTGTVNVSYENM